MVAPILANLASMFPSTIYKYRKPDRINDLRSRTVRLTPPGAFNDPFEALPAVKGYWPPDAVGFLTGETHRLAELDDHELDPCEVLSEIHTFDEQARLKGQEWVKKASHELYGVVPFSAHPDEILMWSHYAKSHEGFVIGFDATNEWFDRREGSQDPINHLAPVKYCMERPSLHLTDIGTGDSSEEAAKLFLTKAKQWEYESEYRVVRRLDAPDVRDEDGMKLLEFPASLVQEVIFGLRMKYEHHAALMEVLDDTPYRHVQKLQVRLSPTEFRITVHEL